MKLTVDLINQSPQFINAIRERELDLRGHKIPVIENLGATLNQFDTIDLSDNDIRKLDGFPMLGRLSSLLLNNNRISRIADHLEENLPKLETLILTNNNIQEICDLETLFSIQTLRYLSLVKNPVVTRKNYREYVVFKMPRLRVLDFRKVSMKDKQNAKKLFKSPVGKELERELLRRVNATAQDVYEVPTGPSPAEIQAIKNAIAQASSLEEIERLNMMLKAGQIPGIHPPHHNGGYNGSNNVEEMEEDMNG